MKKREIKMGQSKLWKLIPKNEASMRECRDFFYSFGRGIHCGTSPHWNGNDFVIESRNRDLEWEFVSPDGENFTMTQLLAEMNSCPRNFNPAKYENPWIRDAERDVPIMELVFERMKIRFWRIYPRRDYEFKKERVFELRISSSSAKKIAEKFKSYYEEEIKQYYEIPVNKDLFPEGYRNSQEFRTCKRMWLFSLDTLVIEYYNDSGNQWTNGVNYGCINIGERDFRYNFYSKTLGGAIRGASDGKHFDCRPDIEAFKQGENRIYAIDSVIENVKTLKTSFGIAEIDDIVKQLENLKQNG